MENRPDDDLEMPGDEGGNMVRIDRETQKGIATEGAFGELAVLLVGFMREDVEVVQELLMDMGAEEVKVRSCL